MPRYFFDLQNDMDTIDEERSAALLANESPGSEGRLRGGWLGCSSDDI